MLTRGLALLTFSLLLGRPACQLEPTPKISGPLHDILRASAAGSPPGTNRPKFAPGSTHELSQLLSGFRMLEVRGLVSCHSRVQASHLLRFPLTEVARSFPSRWLPCSCSPNLPGGTVPALSPSVLRDSRLALGSPSTEVSRNRPSQPASPRKAPRFHLSTPSRAPSGESLHSPADYGLPFGHLERSLTATPATPSRSPWARSTRATARIRLTSLRSVAFCESVHVGGGCPTPHGRSSLGFLPL